MYAFGATFSFTIAHASLVAIRVKRAGGDDVAFRARPNLRLRGVDWPLFAIVGGLGTGALVARRSSSQYAGDPLRRPRAGSRSGFVFYVVYRRRILHVPMSETVRAPIQIGPADALEYRSILVPIAPGLSVRRGDGRRVPPRRGAPRDDRRVTVIEVPLELPLDAYLPEEVEEANEQLDEARAIGESYGVNVIGRIVRARNAGQAIVDEATRRGAEIVVMGGPRRVRLAAGRRAIFGDTVDFVLKHAPVPRDGRGGEGGGVRSAQRHDRRRLRRRRDRARARDPRPHGDAGGGVGYLFGALFVGARRRPALPPPTTLG